MCSDQRDEVFYLDRQQLRLISDPLRQRIIKLLAEKEMSTAELAQAIEDAPSNLYYHVDRLWDAGLIELVRTEPRRGAVEKFYRTVATCFTVAPELVTTMNQERAGEQELLAVVRGVIEETYQGFTRGVARGLVDADPTGETQLPSIIAGITIRTSPERIKALHEKLSAWIQEASEDEGDHSGVEYQGLAMFFPVARASHSTSPPDDAP